MKQLTMFIAMNTDGGDRITYFYDVIDPNTGAITSAQKKDHFFVLDETLRASINSIRSYIRTRLGDPLHQLTSFMALHLDGTDRISYTFDKISPDGRILSTGNKDGFVVLDEALASDIEDVREWLRENKLNEET